MNIVNLKQYLTAVKVSGDDSIKYLQGQLTNDINQLDYSKYQFSAHLNNKGRILASFIITKVTENCYYLITSTDIIEKIIPRLKMFVLRAKVSIEILLENIFFSDKNQDSGVSIELDNVGYLNITLSPTNANNGINEWKNWLITKGIPLIYLPTQEIFTPQQVNYDLIDGVNFKKGCYTGQEIVARMHYLGKIKRRMYRYSCAMEVKIGQQVYSPIMDNQVVGEIVEILKTDSGYIGLVSLQLNCVTGVFIDIENTQALEITTLPYMLEIS